MIDSITPFERIRLEASSEAGEGSAAGSGARPSQTSTTSSGAGLSSHETLDSVGAGGNAIGLSGTGEGDDDGNDGNGDDIFRDFNGRRHSIDATRRYLHLILADRFHGKKQVSVDITCLASDQQIFEKVNEIYREHRSLWRAVLTVKNLRLTKVNSNVFNDLRHH